MLSTGKSGGFVIFFVSSKSVYKHIIRDGSTLCCHPLAELLFKTRILTSLVFPIKGIIMIMFSRYHPHSFQWSFVLINENSVGDCCSSELFTTFQNFVNYLCQTNLIAGFKFLGRAEVGFATSIRWTLSFPICIQASVNTTGVLALHFYPEIPKIGIGKFFS